LEDKETGFAVRKLRGVSLMSGPGPNQRKVPEVVISETKDRAWVGALVQGEGCTGTHYVKVSDSTTTDLTVGMTDSAPVFRFADLCGLSRPERARKRPEGLQPIWVKNVAGLRALRILAEIHTFLVGEKKREVEKAFEVFGVNGYHRGRILPIDVWPPDEFPLRRRRRYFPPRISRRREKES
jgi:hypothetical protein